MHQIALDRGLGIIVRECSFPRSTTAKRHDRSRFFWFSRFVVNNREL
jgi:hypothetical protein